MRMLIVLFFLVVVSCSQEKKPVAEPGNTNSAAAINRQKVPIQFPRDEGAHLEQPLEWWYLNAQFADSAGRKFSFFLCKFSRGRHLVSLFDKSKGTVWTRDYYESVNASETNLDLSSITGYWREAGAPFSYNMMYNYQGVTLQLDLKALKKPFYPGGEGIIAMGEKGSSYYYSLTDLTLSGTLKQGTNAVPVQITGRAWMDHQWGQWDWVKDFDQWKWYSVKLDNGVDLMLFNIYKNKGIINSYCDYMDASGEQYHKLNCQLITHSYYTDARRGKWQKELELQFPDLSGTKLILESENEFQFIEPSVLWEGSMKVRGSFKGKDVSGTAFQELNRPD